MQTTVDARLSDVSRDGVLGLLASFRPLQREAMDAILAGRDSIVVLPTGGGKSLCFQAPALVRDGLAVVVSPLISLMKDQVDTLVGNGVPAACFNSSLSADERRAVTSGAARRTLSAALRLARAAGRARGANRSRPGSRAATSASSPSTKRTASASGDTTSVPSTGSSASCAPGFPGSAFTPTPRRRRHASGATSRPSSVCASRWSSSARSIGPNLVYRVLPRANLKRQLQDMLARHRGEGGIVYCTSRREVEALAAWLTASRACARVPYHAGLDDGERQPQPGRVPRRRDRRHRRHRGLRDGDRPVGRPLRRARRGAAVARALPAGVGPRRPRRPRGRVRADLLVGRLHEVAADAREERRADRQRAAAAARHRALRRQRRVPAPAPGRILRRAVRARRTAAPATSASASSSRSPSRPSSPARSSRASRASASASAPRTWPTFCAAARTSRSCRAGTTS